MNEQQLIQQLKHGNETACKALLNLFGDKVYNTCLGMLQNKEDAEDNTQEVFAEVIQSIHQFREDASLSTWVYRITVTKCLEFIRRKKAKKRFGMVYSIFGQEETVKRSDDSPFYHPGIQLENKERSAALFNAISQLPDNQRTAFVLHKVEGLSYAEIAGVMDVSVSAVESLMVRARQNLQKLLTNYYNENEK